MTANEPTMDGDTPELFGPWYDVPPEIHYMADDLVTADYTAGLFKLIGKLNSAPWRGMDQGTCLLAGVSMNRAEPYGWKIRFAFALTSCPGAARIYGEGDFAALRITSGWPPPPGA